MDNYETGIYTDNPDDTLRYMKSAEVVEVVRCKDCKNYRPVNSIYGRCSVLEADYIAKDFYCMCGVRERGEANENRR